MTLSRTARIIIVVSAACLVLAVYTLFDPASGYFPQCPFLYFTGLQCPGCGSQRAIHALLHADLSSAWSYNPFLMLSVPLLALLAVSASCGTLKRLRSSVWLPRIVLAAVIVWWVARNLI